MTLLDYSPRNSAIVEIARVVPHKPWYNIIAKKWTPCATFLLLTLCV